MKHYVVGFMFNYEASKVLLIKKVRPKWQEGKYNGPGGHREIGESALESMVREFKEETGLETTQEIWTLRVTMYVKDKDGVITDTVNFFSAFGEIGKARTTTDEKVEMFEIRHIQVLNVVPNLRWMIPMCFDDRLDFPVVVTIRSNWT